ncbi:hypothetical protein GCM10009785_28330 [Brooklawnia cerclae]|uniref:Uncharacterized protein n=1 Tax=Brooklawnia cerclae TaxID=349934 RepID=A0ABX0SJN1_9ACTN|nr:hypothetical protein [Brooklawnia cerclae]NIH56876.1 hypothetical protein [Brooklawnia cerclae]
MAKKHKYHNAGLTLSSALTPAQLLTIAKQVAGTLKPLVLDAETPSSLRFLVKNWARVTFMSFGVDVASEGARTALTTTIAEYQTSQATVFFIPIGPKEMLGYGEYRSYMRALADAVVAADPGATFVITETEAA